MNRYTFNITYKNETKKIVISKFSTVNLLIEECLEKFCIVGEERTFDYQILKKNDCQLDKMVQLRFSGVSNNMYLWLELRKRCVKKVNKKKSAEVKLQIVQAGSESITYIDNVEMSKSLAEVVEQFAEKNETSFIDKKEDKEMKMDVFGAVYDENAMSRVKLSEVACHTPNVTLRLIFEQKPLVEETLKEEDSVLLKETIVEEDSVKNEKIDLNVNAKIHKPGDFEAINETHECLSDDYEVTVESAKLYLRSIKNKLKKKNDKETAISKCCYVKVRFPCGNVLVVNFVDPSIVKLKDLIEKIDLFLLEKFILNYTLSLSYPPFSKINTSLASMEKNISTFPEFKSNCVFLIWESLLNDNSVFFLKEEHRLTSKTPSDPNLNETNDTKISDNNENKETNKKGFKHKNKKIISKKMPKWFKMQTTH